MIRKQRAAEVCLAAILDCHTMHGTRWVSQETFLKIYLLNKRISPSLPSDPKNFLLIAKVYLELP